MIMEKMKSIVSLNIILNPNNLSVILQLSVRLVEKVPVSKLILATCKMSLYCKGYRDFGTIEFP